MEFFINAFGATTRTLTGLGTGVIAAVTTIHAALANGAQVDLRPAAGLFGLITVNVEPLANVAWSIGLWDGTTFRVGFTVASGSGSETIRFQNSAFGVMIQNTGTVGGNYNIAGFTLSQ